VSPQAVGDRLESLRRRIAAAARRVGRDPASVVLLGVAKRQPPERVAAAVRAGVDHLGENYVQEAREKQRRVSELVAAAGPAPASPPRWHLIGRLQRNKARLAVELFDVVETVDREDLARELARRAAAAGRRLDVLLQVNASREPQKGGVAPEALPALLRACGELASLRVAGLMTVPAASPDPEAARPAFAQLRALRDTLRDAPGGTHLAELSMGMSADFEVAIEEGATIVRIGTALFGPREGA
jgi:pyridoxal phosphate enzyme (YggS family)